MCRAAAAAAAAAGLAETVAKLLREAYSRERYIVVTYIYIYICVYAKLRRIHSKWPSGIVLY